MVASGTVPTDSDSDHTVHVDALGLTPATAYHYAFSALGESSPVGRTRTLPRPDAGHLKLAMVSCARYDTGYFNGYARMAERDDLDFVLHLGDFIYEGSNAEVRERPATRPRAALRSRQGLHHARRLPATLRRILQ